MLWQVFLKSAIGCVAFHNGLVFQYTNSTRCAGYPPMWSAVSGCTKTYGNHREALIANILAMHVQCRQK